MFNAALYVQAIRLYLANYSSARFYGDEFAHKHFADVCAKIINRAYRTGHSLQYEAGWQFVRSW
jgi:hypothetical protein